MSVSSAFSIRSQGVADRFLQSAVIVDDQARLGSELISRSVVAPSRGPRAQAKAVRETPQSGPGAATHDLDAKQLIDAFAELGIICAVLKPDLQLVSSEMDRTLDPLAALSSRTGLATKRADIVILDWNIPNEERPGQNATRLIEMILGADEPSAVATRNDDHSRRLRLIAIYTGDENLESITGEMADLLARLNLGEVVSNTYRVTAGPVTIAVYGKGKPTIVGADAERRVGEDVLPGRLRDEFSEMTEGLLSNSALEALSAIRTNTHRILSRFNRGVDAPYVAHRAMMQPPEEAEEHPVPLIASEIEGVLADDARIPELVGFKALTEWLEHLTLRDETIQAQLGMNADVFKAALLSLLEGGLEKTGEQQSHPQWEKLMERLKWYDREAASAITQALAREGVDGAARDMEFARLTSLRSQYEAPPPVLKLGSIVATSEGGSLVYLLCIQPLCDSVRLDRSRKFPFLKLKERGSSEDESFDFVITDRESHKRLYVSRKAYDIRVIEMKPDPASKSVRAERVKGDWQFQRKVSGSPVRWLADLKPDFSHRVINEFVGDVARIGLTESEWLRRMAMKTRPALKHGASRIPKTEGSSKG